MNNSCQSESTTVKFFPQTFPSPFFRSSPFARFVYTCMTVWERILSSFADFVGSSDLGIAAIADLATCKTSRDRCQGFPRKIDCPAAG